MEEALRGHCGRWRSRGGVNAVSPPQSLSLCFRFSFSLRPLSHSGSPLRRLCPFRLFEQNAAALNNSEDFSKSAARHRLDPK